MSARRMFAVLAFIVGGFFWMASPASAFGPPPQAPIVSCTEIKLDPPPVSWVKVTMFGSVNRAPFVESAKYGSPVPHWAIVPVHFTGHVDVRMRGSWTLGKGETAETVVSLDCGSTPGGSSLPFTGGLITKETLCGLGLLAVGGITRIVR